MKLNRLQNVNEKSGVPIEQNIILIIKSHAGMSITISIQLLKSIFIG